MSTQRLSTLSLVAYAGPALPLAILGMQLIVYVPPFYAAEIGLDIAAVGGIFFLARLWDAIIDPVIGYLSDGTRTRWGRRKPWLIAGTPLLMLGVYAFLSPPAGIGTRYLVVTAALFYVAWTILQIPYMSWSAELSRDYQSRTRITGFREAGTMLGTVTATVLPILVLRNEDPSLRDILFVFVVALLILIPLTTTLAAAATPNGVFFETGRHGFRQSLRSLAHNRPLLRLLVGILFFWIGGSIGNAAVVFMVEHMLELPRSAFLKFVLVQYVLGVACLPFWVAIGNRIGRHRALVIGAMAYFLIQPMFLLVTPGVFWQGLILYMIIGPVTSVIWLMPPAIVADAVEYGMFKGGADEAALYMASYNFVMKMGLAAGVGIALPLMGAIGFDPSSADNTAAMPGFKFIALFLPGMVACLGAFIMWNYPIDARRHGVIRRWLARRGLKPVST